ncbi:MAG: tripartite tricarboxylate transporter permease, partial [Pseudomonadota bacterium]
SANNATVGGGFIPTLVLGIPGTPPDAVILGALLVQGVRTGPSLFSDGANIVYTFIFGLLLATILMLPVGLLIGRFAYGAIVRAPKAALVPAVAFMTVIGTFAIRNSISDIAIMIALGVVGWLASKRGFSVSPIVLGLILGRIAEQGFVQSWTIGDAIGDLWGQFFGRPLSMAIIALTILTFFYPFWPRIKGFVSRAPAAIMAAQDRAAAPALIRDLIALIIAGAMALVALQQSADLNPEAAVFPRTIATAMAVLVALAIGRLLLTRHVTEEAVDGSWLRMAALPVVMLGAVLLFPTLGFGGPAVVMGLVLAIVAQHDKFSPKGTAILLACVAAIIIACTLLFSEVLSVPLP